MRHVITFGLGLGIFLSAYACHVTELSSPTSAPVIATVTSTAANVPVSSMPTAMAMPVTPTKTPTLVTDIGVPFLEGYQSMAPYRIVAYHQGQHNHEIQIVKGAASDWEDATGLNLFDDSSPNLIGVIVEGDPECTGVSHPISASPPGVAEEPYAAFIWLCSGREFLDDGCDVVTHELGHVLLLADNKEPGSNGTMSYWKGHKPGEVISYNEWCHSPILEQEAIAVRQLN